MSDELAVPSVEEKFIFDLDGYIVIKDVLSVDEVDELNARADEKMSEVGGDEGFACIPL